MKRTIKFFGVAFVFVFSLMLLFACERLANKVVSAIELEYQPNKLEYELGEAMDLTGGSLKITYSDSTSESVELSKATISGFDSSQACPNLKLTATYGDKTTHFFVSVGKEFYIDDLDAFLAAIRISDTTIHLNHQLTIDDVIASGRLTKFDLSGRILSCDSFTISGAQVVDIDISGGTIITNNGGISINSPEGTVTLEDFNAEVSGGNNAAISGFVNITNDFSLVEIGTNKKLPFYVLDNSHVVLKPTLTSGLSLILQGGNTLVDNFSSASDNSITISDVATGDIQINNKSALDQLIVESVDTSIEIYNYLGASVPTITGAGADNVNVYHQVEFDLGGGTKTGGGDLSQWVLHGATPNAPTATKDNKSFIGWLPQLTQVTQPTEFVAEWGSLYNIQSSAGAGGSITPLGTMYFDGGESQTYTFTPSLGYQIKEVLIDGVNNTTAVTQASYTFSNISQSHTIEVIFEVQTFTVSLNSGLGTSISATDGSISPVEYGGSFGFEVTVEAAYDKSQPIIKVNNLEIIPNKTGDVYSYVIENIVENITVIVDDLDKNTYTITSIANEGGVLSPIGAREITYGYSISYAIEPEKGYRIGEVLIDGVADADALSFAVENEMYTFMSVQSDRSIEVVFELIPKYSLTLTSTDGGTVSGSGSFAEGESVTIQALVDFAYLFVGWFDGDTSVSANANFTFDMPASELTYQARFVLEDYHGGSGTELDPYIIMTEGQLAAFAIRVNTMYGYSLNKYFELGANLDLAGIDWMPIGYRPTYHYSNTTFLGSFDGKGFEINNLTCTKETIIISTEKYVYAGLFGVAYNAIIKNVTVNNYNLSFIGIENVSSFIGGGLVGHSLSSTITSCHANGTINIEGQTDALFGTSIRAGGLVGENGGGGLISDSSATVDLYAHSNGNVDVGGLLGYHIGMVTNCHSFGRVDATATAKHYAADAGGLIGTVHNDATKVENCSSDVDVFVVGVLSGVYGGGLIGGVYGNNMTITNCFALGSVTAQRMVDDEQEETTTFVYAGGLIGEVNNGVSISKCYSIGDVDVSGPRSVMGGGLVGSLYGTITDCYALGNVNAVSASAERQGTVSAGGLIGSVSSGDVTNSFAAGNVQTSLPNSGIGMSGGLVGSNHFGSISNSFAVGNASVSGINVHVGGLAGWLSTEAEETNNYRYTGQQIQKNDEVAPSNTLGTVVTAEQLNDETFYVDTLKLDTQIWDLDNLDIENAQYPTLKSTTD